MLNKEKINKEFWEIIKVHYEKECYTDALKDACLYLIQIVQEKSELEELDGEKLITHAFSESNPKLLINNNQTQTEKDEQRGYGFLLRGIICAIRNPISHNRSFVFSKEEADSILIFMNNYILEKLSNSKNFKYVSDWYNFIFCDNDNDSKRFSDTILGSVSKKEKFKLMIDIVSKLETIKPGKYYYIINQLYNNLTSKEKEEIIILLNKKLIIAKDAKYIRMFFNHFNPEIWEKFDSLVKIRIEEMVYNSIKEGKSYIDPRTMQKEYTGSLGAWAVKWIEKFNNKSEIVELIFKKLKYEREAEYVLNYFSEILRNSENLKKYSKDIKDGLNKGKIQYQELLEALMFFEDEEDEIFTLFKDEYKNFKPKKIENELPF